MTSKTTTKFSPEIRARTMRISPHGIAADELWEIRNSIPHMTNLASRKIVAGKVSPIMPYVSGTVVNTEFGEPATAKINEAEIQVMAARIERSAGELELATSAH